MLKITKYLFLLMGLSILFIAASCEKEEPEPRTRELEMAELDKKIKELEAKGINIDTTNLSVFYFVLKAGEGPYPKVGDSCLVSYIGFLPDGSIFEDSREIHPPDAIWRFNYKPPHKVAGLVNGIGYMNTGAEIEMYITSDNAFGSKGSATVPPFTTLIYRAKMHDLISKE
jgi:FKBP-type peptidyl-prolyl cis-trans isomerase FkpA